MRLELHLTWRGAPLTYTRLGDFASTVGELSQPMNVAAICRTRSGTACATGKAGTHLREYLAELQSTGFDVRNIETVASMEPAPKPWQVGEVLAEVLLEDTENATFPWPPSWDKRTASASLPGPDIIGFHAVGDREHFLFGEIKSSDAKDLHASVIYGDDGLRNQIHRLVASEERRHVLIAWLKVRAPSQAWKARFDCCLAAYFAETVEALIVGVLLSGLPPDESHLAPVRTVVEASGTAFQVLLLGYYLPIPPC